MFFHPQMTTLKKGGVKRLMKEMENISNCEEPNVSASPIDPSNMYKWHGVIIGPKGTPYEGGIFKLEITFPADYPFKAPRVEFLTQIYHCNVQGKHLCLDILKNQWSPALTIDKVLISISSLMNEPNASDPLNRDAAEKYLTCPKEYDRIAREWTREYASPKDDKTTRS